MESKHKLVSAMVIEGIGIRRGTLYRMVKEGRVPCYRVGGKQRGLLFDLSEVLEAIRQPVAATETMRTESKHKG